MRNDGGTSAMIPKNSAARHARTSNRRVTGGVSTILLPFLFWHAPAFSNGEEG